MHRNLIPRLFRINGIIESGLMNRPQAGARGGGTAVKRKDLIITIDGPSGAGKSSTARALADALGYLYLETGGLYRAVGWKLLQERIDPGDVDALKALCRRIEITVKNAEGRPRILIGEKDVTDELKTPQLDRVSSQISAAAPVRECLLRLQREVGGAGGVVVEGRDIGTVVFPDADVKFYLDASGEVRARRRYEELRERGYGQGLDSVHGEIQARDRRDTERSLAPLCRPEDAIFLDTSDLTLTQVVDRMLVEIRKKVSGH